MAVTPTTYARQNEIPFASTIQIHLRETMSTAFEPSLSSSIGRQTMAPAGPSVADTLPNINFGFDDLRDRMNKFTARFDAFIEQGRKRVLAERNQFRMNVAELQGAILHKPHSQCGS